MVDGPVEGQPVAGELEVEVSRESDGSLLGKAGPFFSGTKYGDIECKVRVAKNENLGEDAEDIVRGEFKSLDEFNGNFGITVEAGYGVNYYASEESNFELAWVPSWYLFSPETKIEELPIDARVLSDLTDPLGEERKGILSPDMEEKYRIFLGYDLNAADIETRSEVSAKECLEFCEDVEECGAVTYDRWNRYCFLKEYPSQALLLANSKADSIVGRASVRSIEKSASGRELFVQQNKAFFDVPYALTPVQRVDECAAACEGDQRCVAFSFGAGQCSVFDQPNVYSDRMGFQAGIYSQRE